MRMFKIFGTDGIRCKVNKEPMTPDTCSKNSQKQLDFYYQKKIQRRNRVVISKDTRLSGYLYRTFDYIRFYFNGNGCYS